MLIYACRSRDSHEKVRYATLSLDQAEQWCRSHQRDLWHGYDVVSWQIGKIDGTMPEEVISSWRDTPFYTRPPETLEENNARLDRYYRTGS